MSELNIEYFKKAICALNNSEGGYIIFGLSKEKIKIGLTLDKDKNDKKYLENIIDAVNSLGKKLQISRPNIYPLQNDRLLISIRIPKSEYLINIKEKGEIYYLKNEKLILLEADEIQNLIEKKVMNKVEEKIEKRLNLIESECLSVKNYFNSIPILNKYEGISKSIYMYVKDVHLLHPSKLSPEISQDLKDKYYSIPNGTSRGNIFLLAEEINPRLKEGYLRYSLPVWLKTNISIKTEKKETIYICSGGGCFYSPNLVQLFPIEYNGLVTIFHASQNDINGKIITSILKSTFWIWYLKNKFDVTDFLPPPIFNDLKFPEFNIKNPQDKFILKRIEVLFDNILMLEKKFLTMLNENLEIIKNEEKFFHMVKNHNDEVAISACEIDKLIYKKLMLEESEIKLIESNVKASGYYICEDNMNEKIIVT